MKVLIIGGAGYIGSVTTRLFLSHGAQVTVLDNLLFNGESLGELSANPNFKLIQGDVRNKESVENAVKGIDVIINLAAIVGEPLCAKYPKLAYETNYQAACMVGDIAKKYSVKKYIFVSTCSNYGISTTTSGATEESELKPLSLYAETKINAEIYISKLASESFTSVVVRFATVFGLSPRMRFDLLVSEFVKEAFLRKKITVYNPDVFRPLIHVVDASEALLLLAETSKEIAGEVFNVGFDNYQKSEIIKMITGKIPGVEITTLKEGTDKRDYRVSFEKIKKVLDYKAMRSLEKGIDETIEALKQNLYPNPDDSRYKNTDM